MSVKLSQLVRHIQPGSFGRGALRTALPPFVRKCKVSLHEGAFSIMSQNMGLLVPNPVYKGTDRKGVIRELIEQIRLRSPDVVGVCEIFDNSERNQVFNALKAIYPWHSEGPDRNTILDGRAAKEDGGLLLLSKHRLTDSASVLYTTSTGADWLVNKGILYMRIQPEGLPFHLNLFYTHMQDIDAVGGGGQQALYEQLTQAANYMEGKRLANSVSILFGDINVPAQRPENYSQMMTRLKSPVDIWVASGNDPNQGFTFAENNNFYANPDDTPTFQARLDYFLLTPAQEYIPVVSDMQVLQLKHNGRDISDHFGIAAVFNDYVSIVRN